MAKNKEKIAHRLRRYLLLIDLIILLILGSLEFAGFDLARKIWGISSFEPLSSSQISTYVVFFYLLPLANGIALLVNKDRTAIAKHTISDDPNTTSI